jgi:NAD(P)-dependent dehydrogenase (short-subunit alcohol dehydrogenase family)
MAISGPPTFNISFSLGFHSLGIPYNNSLDSLFESFIMLSNKTCVVSAGTGGIGKGIVKALLREGAFVFLSGRTTNTVDAVIAEFKAEGFDRVVGIVSDVSTVAGSQVFFDSVANSGREIDVLVNNLGVFEAQNFFEYSDEDWLNYFNTNVLSTVRFCRHYLKPMLERNRGRVIIVSSEAGFRPIGDMIPYSMTKAAQINIARGLAEVTKGTKVTVNSLLPGPTATEGVSALIDGLMLQGLGATKDEATANYFKNREPTSLLQRFLTVEEVANVAVFLASDLSSGINGAAQLVEGGIIRSI